LDWLSFGATRGLLRSVIKKRHGFFMALFTACLDLLLALIFLGGVLLATLGGLKLVEITAFLAGKEPVFTASNVWHQLLNGSLKENLWLWVTLASTLIPTAFHFLVILLALVTLPFTSQSIQKVVQEYERARESGRLHSDARLKAFFTLLFSRGGALGAWFVMIWYSFKFLFTYLPIFFEKCSGIIKMLYHFLRHGSFIVA